MDTEAALILALWQRLNDRELRDIMGLETEEDTGLTAFLSAHFAAEITVGARDPLPLHIDTPPPEEPFPYMVHRVSPRVDREVFGFVSADYRLDLWDGPNAGGLVPTYDRVQEMRRRVIELLDRFDGLTAPNGEFQEATVDLDVDQPVPEEGGRARHRHMIFVVRYWRTAEVNHLLAQGR